MKNKLKISYKKLSIGSLVAISIAGVFSIRSLTGMAEYGFSLVSYYLLAAILFFIPSSLIFSELATIFPQDGGLYIWVREALGEKLGFLAIWLEWSNNIVSMPTMLSFGAVTLIYLVHPAWMKYHYLIFFLMLCFIWGLTYLNIYNIKLSLKFSAISAIIGALLPVLFLILLGFFWLFFAKSEIHMSIKDLIPHLHLHNIALLSGLILSFAGMQVVAFHARDVDNPQKNYPRAMLIAAIIIVIVSIAGALAIAIVIPKEKLSLVAGLLQIFQEFLHYFHLDILFLGISSLLFIGFIANFNLWLLSPARGLQACAKYGYMPKMLSGSYDKPHRILIMQSIIASLLCLLFIFLPSLNNSYWLLTVLCAQLTFIMDILIAISAIKLRYSKPNLPRLYRIPGGQFFGIYLVSGVMIIVCIIAFIIGFFPPTDLIQIDNKLFYDIFLIVMIVMIISCSFIISIIRQKKNY